MNVEDQCGRSRQINSTYYAFSLAAAHSKSATHLHDMPILIGCSQNLTFEKSVLGLPSPNAPPDAHWPKPESAFQGLALIG